MNNKTYKLDTDFIVLYVEGSDGGGINHLSDFKQAVSLSGKSNYHSAVEWCAGFGVIGFEFLRSGICNNMSFIDCHEPTISWLQKTIDHNNLQSNTALYHIDAIGLLPEHVKFDLVLANPPHCFDQTSKEMFERTIENPKQKADVIRLVCDVDYMIHKEFFDNIREHLLPNADVFISETANLKEIKQFAINAGLIWIDTYPAPKLSIDRETDAVIFHFKEPL